MISGFPLWKKLRVNVYPSKGEKRSNKSSFPYASVLFGNWVEVRERGMGRGVRVMVTHIQFLFGVVSG
jgi:hypothetical protein